MPRRLPLLQTGRPGFEMPVAANLERYTKTIPRNKDEEKHDGKAFVTAMHLDLGTRDERMKQTPRMAIPCWPNSGVRYAEGGPAMFRIVPP